MKIWTCKIGEVDAEKLPCGADLPMRKAIVAAYRQITGEEPEFIFSGWGGELDEGERLVAQNYDAVIKDATIAGIYGSRRIAFGRVYGDRKGRFDDGTTIRTSAIVSGPDENGIIQTRNSRYKLELIGERTFN